MRIVRSRGLGRGSAAPTGPARYVAASYPHRVVRIWLLFILLDLVLTIAALIACGTTDDGDIDRVPKLVWMLLIVFVPLVGPILWFVYGTKPRLSRRRSETWRAGNGFPEWSRPRSLAPDDDPEFLSRIDGTRAAGQVDDAELLRRWEADLRRREEELKRARRDDEPS